MTIVGGCKESDLFHPLHQVQVQVQAQAQVQVQVQVQVKAGGLLHCQQVVRCSERYVCIVQAKWHPDF